MIRNYFKIAYRNLLNSKFYSFINIAGLAVGIACCLLIMLFVQNELSYDQHHPHADRLYRIKSDINYGGEHAQYGTTPAPLAAALLQEYPGIAQAGRLGGIGHWLLRITDPSGSANTYKEDDFAFADPAILDLFSIDLIKGNEKTALSKPNTLIISEALARKCFGNEDPIGKMVLVDNTDNFMVTGVYKNIPSNTHFYFDVLASMESLERSKNGMWLNNNFYTYIRLTENVDPESMEAKFPGLIAKYMTPQAEALLGLDTEDFETNPVHYFLQPVQDIHLYSDLATELGPNGDIKYVYIFSAIAIFILIIACINFMNLSTARSAKRAREVGIRKAVGSERGQLIGQFLAESFFLGLLALLIGLGLVELFLPAFNNMAGKSLEIHYFDAAFLLSAFVLVLLIGLFAGAYPAFFLSSFKPAEVLKGGLLSGSARSNIMRSGLVVFQFIISIVLIVGTAIIYKQLRYIQNKSLGFNKEQVIVLHNVFGLGNQLTSFKEELLQSTAIVSATISGYLPVSSSRSSTLFFTGGTPTKDNSISMQNWRVDEDYLKTMGIALIKGRDFREGAISDSATVILNEAAVRRCGFENPIGKKIYSYSFLPNGSFKSNEYEGYTVIGVVKDFHYSSLREQISPLGLFLGKSSMNLSLRIKTKDIPGVIAYIESHWEKIAQGQPFVYTFLDEDFNQMYRSEMRTGKITAVFSSLAIFIACLGLFGLAAFTAEQRTKEVGVRKVLGASTADVVLLFFKDFSKLIVMAFFLAVPLSWWVMSTWLQAFAYRTSIGFGVFLLSGGLALVVAWITIGYQSLKAALANPVDALKRE